MTTDVISDISLICWWSRDLNHYNVTENMCWVEIIRYNFINLTCGFKFWDEQQIVVVNTGKFPDLLMIRYLNHYDVRKDVCWFKYIYKLSLCFKTFLRFCNIS